MSKTFQQLEPVVTELDKRIKTNLDAYPTDTAEGAIATFTDGADNVPVKSLVVNVDPVQDLHGYANPWPGGGGKNLLDPSGVTLYRSDLYGLTMSYDGTEEKYTIAGTYSGTDAILQFNALRTSAESGLNVIGFSTSANFDRLAMDGTTIGVKLKNMVNGTTYNIVIYPMLYTGDTTPTAFSPYSNICPITGFTGANVTVSPTNNAEDGETLDITFPAAAGTVYSGTLDVTNGVLVVDKLKHVFDGSEQISTYATGDDKLPLYTPSPAIDIYGNGKSNMLKLTTSYRELVEKPGSMRLGQNGVAMHFSGYKGSALATTAFKQMLASLNPALEIVYPLATPITYQLTPTEVKSLLGANNIWADTGDTTVEYRADTSAYIAKKIGEAISALS